MAQQTINVGAAPNDGTGTPLRTAFQYTNSNFSELYTATGPSGNNIVVPGNATITGDLTVDTSTLKVDSANDRVGIGTATPYATLHANSAIAAANFDWTTTFTAPTVGLLATSNNSSAWIRIATLDSNPTHDPYVNFLTSGGQNWSVGIDNSDSDKFKIALSNGFTGSNEIFAVDPSAVFSWFDGAGGTRMTLNSTGLGVGVSPSYKFHTVVTSGAVGAFRASTAAIARLLVGNTVEDVELKVNANGDGQLTANASKYLGLGSGGINDRVILDTSGNLLVGLATAGTTAAKTIQIANGTAPTANVTGGQLYVEAGALKYRGSSGTVTTIANA